MLIIILQIVVGLVGGIAAAFQAVFSGLMGQRLGDWESVFFTYVGGGLLIMAAMFTVKGGGNLANWRELPWYVFLAGPLGLVIIASLSYTVPRLGAATATTLFVTAWLILSAIIDHFGLFGGVPRPLDLPRLLGFIILLAGTWLVVR
jgi:transporter family-2 protein